MESETTPPVFQVGDLVAPNMRIVYRGAIPNSTCQAIVLALDLGYYYTWPDKKAWRQPLPGDTAESRSSHVAHGVTCTNTTLRPDHEPKPQKRGTGLVQKSLF